MRVGSCFAGIGGIDLALERAGLQVAWQIEIDRTCNRVLERHWPEVPKFGDITKVEGERLGAIDVLVGGFPCTDVSVAGRRAGLAGEQSGLFWQFARLVGELRPRWIIVENVPGLLSCNNGRDMLAILEAMEALRYAVEFDILDAQFYGVAQRRRRIFMLCHDVTGQPKKTPYYAHIGAQAIGEALLSALAETARQSCIMPTSLDWSSFLSDDGRRRRMRLFGVTDCSHFEKWLICLDEGSRKHPPGPTSWGFRSDEDEVIAQTEMDTLSCLLEKAMASYAATWNTDWSWRGCWADLWHSRSEFTTLTDQNATTDQTICCFALALLSIAPYTLRLMHSYPILYDTASWSLTASAALIDYARQASSSLFSQVPGRTEFWRFIERGAVVWRHATGRHSGGLVHRAAAVLFEPESLPGYPPPRRASGVRVAGRAGSGAQGRGWRSGADEAAGGQLVIAGSDTSRYHKGTDSDGNGLVAFHLTQDPITGDVAPAIGATSGGMGVLTTRPLYYSHDYNQDRIYDPAGLLPATTTHDSGQTRKILDARAVRRLMPIEVERLFGLPDGWTAVDAEGKPIADSARYRMLGNSVSVPTVAWIGRRLLAVDEEIKRDAGRGNGNDLGERG